MNDNKNYEMEAAPQGGVIPTAGKSAHQLWLDEGNVGTVLDFLNSLKIPDINLSDLTPDQIEKITGVKGDKGERGEKGDRGFTGEKGNKGDTGDKGDTGERGMTGLGNGGTTNLLDDSDFSSLLGWGFQYNDPRGTIEVTASEAKVLIPYGDYFSTPELLLYSGESYTFSFDVRSDTSFSVDKNYYFGSFQKSLSPFETTTAWSRIPIMIVGVTKTGKYRIGLGHSSLDMIIYVRNFKVERGIVSDPKWSPSLNSMHGERGERGAKGESGERGATGAVGENGVTWLPYVSSDGNISWSKGGNLTPPVTVNIKGEKGDKGVEGNRGASGATGAAGVKGVDGKNGENGKNGESIGVNLFANSCFRSRTGWFFSPFGPVGNFTVTNNIANVNLPSNSRFAFTEFNFDMLGEYTYSFEARTDNGYQLNAIHFVGATSTLLDDIILIKNVWTRGHINFTVSEVGRYYITIGQRDGLTIDIQLRKMKLERGRKSEPEWTPSIIEIASGSTDGFL